MYSKKLLVAGLGFLATTTACNGLKMIPGPEGLLCITVLQEAPYGINTKSVGVDSYVFLLLGQEGDTLQQSTVGRVTSSPLSLQEGEYIVQVYNRPFVAPAFDSPLYFAQARASVVAGTSCEVTLVCTQVNAGVRVTFTDDFLQQYPSSHLSVSDTVGTLDYLTFGQGRWGYFFPGPAKLCLYLQEDSLVKANKTLLPKYMYTYTVAGDGVTEKSVEPIIYLSVDSSYVEVSEPWNSTTILADGSSKERAYSVAQARLAQTDTASVWISGYVVGQFTSKTNVITAGENLTDTNVALADSAPFNEVINCMPVELNKASIKAVIGIASNPQILNKRVWVKGVVTSYFSQTGVKTVSAAEVE